MVKLVFRSRLWVAMVLTFAVIIPTGEVFAREGREEDHSRDHRGSIVEPHRRELVSVGRRRYYYDQGNFFRWSLFGYVTIKPPAGVVVSILPFGYKTIVVGGAKYFCYNNVYYSPRSSGYVVVPQPQIIYGPVVDPGLNRETVVINVPNRNGTYTAITLLKRDNGYVGPQGEYYSGHPTVEQLRALYGS